MRQQQNDYFPIFLAGILSGVIFAVSVLIGIKITPGEMQNINMSYPDFITIMLTAVTVVITILAIFIAILAFWGYSQFQKMTETASKEHLERLLKEGPFAKGIEGVIVQHVSEQLERGKLRSILIERVDSILLNDASRRAEIDPAASNDKPFTD
ncbi:hypothetical protein ACIQWS_02225 [Phyllobacterium sp. NPDC097923]|uniref:hypothetical protein n=1 Tax=Phyllobacterium sp. NPDC097923 TaxID=3364404 RepID=UPI00383B68C3